MPQAASELAGKVDDFFAFMVVACGLLSFAAAGLITYFALAYRRDRSINRDNPPHHSSLLESVWVFGLFLLFMVMFIWSADLFFQLQARHPGSDKIYVVGRQWMWKIQHAQGKQEINELHVPVGRPIELLMTSEDVIHSFFVPAFRLKQDVLPGRYTVMSFTPDKVGSYHLFCAEYCGTSHSAMIGRVVVMPPAEFQDWLEGEDNVGRLSMAEAGQNLFRTYNCETCHRENGRGPPLQGLFGKRVPLEGGASTIADEGYIRESIVNPNTKITLGYPGVMPTYKGLITEPEILQLVAFIRSLGESP